jgi:hypothetical protein
MPTVEQPCFGCGLRECSFCEALSRTHCVRCEVPICRSHRVPGRRWCGDCERIWLERHGVGREHAKIVGSGLLFVCATLSTILAIYPMVPVFAVPAVYLWTAHEDPIEKFISEGPRVRELTEGTSE